MHLDRPPDLTPGTSAEPRASSAPPSRAAAAGELLRLSACAGERPGRVGRKAAVLGWAETQGLATPGGLVLPADRFWAALAACGVGEQARYLQGAAFRLDPSHALEIAGSIAEAMRGSAARALARADAEAAFGLLAAARVVCRSSSAMEDGGAAAFPGVFVSVLDLCSPTDLADAIVDCWTSVFSADAIRYVLRAGAEPLDLSLALLLQRQVEADWYGIYASVDPLTGAAEPLADLSDLGPDALVGGSGATLRARRRDGRWEGVDRTPSVSRSLEAVRRAAERLAAQLQSEVDLEFALLGSGGAPVILQCRPLTRIGRDQPGSRSVVGPGGLGGRGCAGGQARGVAVEPIREGAPAGDARAIAVVERLTAGEHGIVFRHAGVVMEHDASSLSHVAILCRELGVPLISGVAGARARLRGRAVAIDGGSGEIEILAGPAAVAMPPPPHAVPREAMLSAVELLLRLLAEGRPGHPPAEEAERITKRYARDLGAQSVRLTMHHVNAAELHHLERLGVARFGPDFSTLPLLLDLLRDSAR